MEEGRRLRLFENRILRMRMGSGEGSTKRNFIVCTVHLIVRVIKARRLRWAVHVVRMEKSRSALKILERILEK